jgi:hypothetical protein
MFLLFARNEEDEGVVARQNISGELFIIDTLSTTTSIYVSSVGDIIAPRRYAAQCPHYLPVQISRNADM